MGRPPIGDRAMSTAERMRRYRARLRNSKPVTKQARVEAELQEKVLELRNEITRLKRQNLELAAANHKLRSRKGLWTQAQFNRVKACLHPDSRGNFTDATLTQVRLWIESFEKMLVRPGRAAVKSCARIGQTFVGRNRF
jgi:hypothetical protein